MKENPKKILIAASGTGGHLFPALALAQQLPEYEIEWLGVPDRLETKLVPQEYTLHKITIEGFQKPLGLKTFTILGKIINSVFKVKKLIQEKKYQAVVTTGGYIAAPAILGARLNKIPVILHEANFIPGKVTKLFSPLCDTVALGFQGTAQYLPKAKTVWVSTPVRSQFLTPPPLDLPIPTEAPLIVVVGGSQGAVAVNQIVRKCLSKWLETGAVVVHLTGDRDPETNSVESPNYLPIPFYDNMAALFKRADLAISRAGAGTLTELAVSQTPAILIPYPYAAEDHQTYNAQVFAEAGAAIVYPQSELTPEILEKSVLELLQSPEKLEKMTLAACKLAVKDSASRLAELVKSIKSAR